MPASPRSRWGWHQLADREARRLVTAAGVGPGDLVVDVGAGTGAITAPLLAAGARVVAVELHGRRAEILRKRFEGMGVTVVRTDATDLRLPRQPFRVVANPPFGVTTALLSRLLAPGSRLVRADLIVPVHVAQRWATGRAPGHGRWRAQFDVAAGRRVPPSAFRPAGPPSAVLIISSRHRSR